MIPSVMRARMLPQRMTVANPMKSGSIAARARQRRWTEFMRRFPDLADMKVLDLGGTPGTWLMAPAIPASVTIVNLLHFEQPVDDRITTVNGNACEPPDHVMDQTYDLVYSNSLLEHVGGHLPRLQLAEVIEKTAPRYWVQTPYRYFPVEPHWVFPGMQFLPLKARSLVARTWTAGNRNLSAAEDAVDDCEWVDLLDITATRAYFPDAEIWHERFAGLVKSIVAIRCT